MPELNYEPCLSDTAASFIRVLYNRSSVLREGQRAEATGFLCLTGSQLLDIEGDLATCMAMSSSPYIDAIGQIVLMVTYLINMWLQHKMAKTQTREGREREQRLKMKIDQTTQAQTEQIKGLMRTRVSDLSKRLDGLLEGSKPEIERRESGQTPGDQAR
jgi:hypothetical protein